MSALVHIIPERDRRRIVAAAGLLASDRDGEVVAAARAACRMLAPYGITPAGLMETALKVRGGGAPMWDHRKVARECLDAAQALNDWEIGFLLSVARERSLTDKQRDKLKNIHSKIGREFRS